MVCKDVHNIMHVDGSAYDCDTHPKESTDLRTDVKGRRVSKDWPILIGLSSPIARSGLLFFFACFLDQLEVTMRRVCAIAVFFSLVLSVTPLSFYVTPGTKRCVKEEVHKSQMVVGQYSVSGDLPGVAITVFCRTRSFGKLCRIGF